MNYDNHIATNRAICGGQPVIAGTRVTIKTLLASLADGDTIADIVRDYPTITEDDVRAAIAFAAASASDDLPPPPTRITP